MISIKQTYRKIINYCVKKFLPYIICFVKNYLTAQKHQALGIESGLLDKAWYLYRNPDIKKPNIKPLKHYILYGGFKGRDPEPVFSSTAYFQRYVNVRKANINPLIHYLKFRRKEGRLKGLSKSSTSKNIYLNIVERKPDVSVIIPIYNKSEYLQACLESVLSQNTIHLEVICVDDCSSDLSYEILEQIAKKDLRIKVERNEENKGAAYSRNHGISIAQGKYLQFTDADDLLPPSSLELLFEAAERTGSEVVRGSLDVLDNMMPIPLSGPITCEEKTGTLIDLEEIWIPWWHQCYLIFRDLVVREKIYFPNLVAGEDPVFLSKVLTSAKQICLIPHQTYIYRPNKKRTPPKYNLIKDYITHVHLVKINYIGEYTKCWSFYREFIIKDIKSLISISDLSFSERQSLEMDIQKI